MYGIRKQIGKIWDAVLKGDLTPELGNVSKFDTFLVLNCRNLRAFLGVKFGQKDLLCAKKSNFCNSV